LWLKIASMKGARPRHLLAIAAVIAFAAARSAQGSPGFQRPLTGERLEPSAIVDVSWILDDSRLKATECELVLSLDGGATFPIRVTADLDPSTHRIAWRVPALATSQARLALRVGSDENPSEETLRLLSPPFVIVAAPQAPLEELLPGRSEWRTREAASAGGAGPSAAGFLTKSAETMRSVLDRETSAEPGSVAAILPQPFETARSSVALGVRSLRDDPVPRSSNRHNPLRE
jgi:hypothetical protein